LQQISFLIKSSNLILSHQNKINLLSCKAHKNCSEIYKNYFNQEYDPKKSSVKSNLTKYVPVELLKEVTAPVNEKKNFSPLFTNHKGICRLESFIIPIDCLVLVDSNSNLSNLYEIMLEKLNLHLQAIKQCYVAHYQNENVFKPETYHFLVENTNLNQSNLILTCVYPSNKSDENLVALRKEIHTSLELPMDRPLLRRIDEFRFQAELEANDISSKYLVNPHLSAKPSGLQNSKQTTVFGNYCYFHYMQDVIKKKIYFIFRI